MNTWHEKPMTIYEAIEWQHSLPAMWAQVDELLRLTT